MDLKKYKSIGSSLISILLIALPFFTRAQNTEIKDLPLRIFYSPQSSDTYVIYVTGDGGWNSFSENISKEIVKEGFNLVVLDSRKYFWSAKSPEQYTKDFELITDYYLKDWKKERFAIVGYSFGADVSAFLPARIQETCLKKLSSMVLISPAPYTDFEIRLIDLLGSGSNIERKYKVSPEINQSSVTTLVVFGEDEDLSIKSEIQENGKVTKRELPGAHQYEDSLPTLIKLIIDNLKAR